MIGYYLRKKRAQEQYKAQRVTEAMALAPPQRFILGANSGPDICWADYAKKNSTRLMPLA